MCLTCGLLGTQRSVIMTTGSERVVRVRNVRICANCGQGESSFQLHRNLPPLRSTILHTCYVIYKLWPTSLIAAVDTRAKRHPKCTLRC